MADTPESLKADGVLGKYAKIYSITHAPIERVLKNMDEDGVSEANVNRFRTVFDESYTPAASAGGGVSGGVPAGFQSALDAMESNILAKIEAMILDREERIIAAIKGGAAPAATMAANPAPTYTPAPAPPKPAAAAPKAAPAPKPAPPPKPAKKASSGPAAEVIDSSLCSTDMSTWKAMAGVRSTSGIQVEESCKAAYDRVRKDRNGVRWVMFEFDAKFAWIYPTKEGLQSDDYIGDWEQLVELLPEKKAVYVLYNFEYEDQGGSGYAQEGMNVMKNKMVLFAWTDSKCKVKERMVAASSQSAIKQVCRGSCDAAVHDKADMTFDMVCKDLNG